MTNFKVGDRVRLKSGHKFSNGEDVATIKNVEQNIAHFIELKTWEWEASLELVLPKYPNPPHKHRDLIIEWANGADIQVCGSDGWVDVSTPQWYEIREYRVKPQKSEKELEIESIQKQIDELKERLEKLKGE